MKNNLIVLLVFIGQCHLLIAQNNIEKMITGTVTSDLRKLEGISVINYTTKTMAVTDKDGCFSIEAKQGNILFFSGIDYQNLSKYVYNFEFNSGTMLVNMVFNSIELDEVIVNKYANINAKNLGLISDNQVKLTPQERKLYANSGGVLGLYSYLSGERAILKKNVEIEKKELLMKKLEFLFDDKYYIKRLKIPEELIRGFQYYCIEDSEFVKSLNLKNKTKSMFLITNLALIYNKNRMKAD
jgi:hypothetical protein